MPLLPPPADNASLPDWVRTELYPWAQTVESVLAAQDGRLDNIAAKGLALRDRTERLRDKIVALLQRIRATLPVRGQGAPTIYDEMALFRAAFADLEVPPEEWPDA
jgi:hypothetical protein